MEMTKEQAYKNLSLVAGADLETIRIRFAARYSRSDEAYDHALTEGMKAVHEEHLRELEAAYKVLTDSPVISDMGTLLSLSKGYIAEGGDTLGGEQLSPEEALAFFALYPHDTPLKAEQRYTLYKNELEETVARTGLEASREPFRQEIARADACLQVAVNYLMANEMLQSRTFFEEQVEDAADNASSVEETPVISTVEADTATPVVPTVKTAQTRWLLLFGAIVLLAAVVAGGLRWDNRDDAPAQPASLENAVEHPASPGALSERNAQAGDRSAAVTEPVAQQDRPVATSSRQQQHEVADTTTREAITHQADLHRLASLLETLSAYRLGEESSHSLLYLMAKNSTKRSFLVPLLNVDTVNGAGTLQAKEGRTFLAWYAQGKPVQAAAVPGFLTRTATPSQKKALMKVLLRLGAKSGGQPITIAPASDATKQQHSATQQDAVGVPDSSEVRLFR